MQRKRISLNLLKINGSQIILIVCCGILLFTSCQNNSVCDPTLQPKLTVKFSTHQKYKRTSQNSLIDSLGRVLILKVYALKALKPDSSIQDSTGLTGSDGFSAPVSNLDSSSRYVIVVNINPGGIGNAKFINDTLSITYSKRLKFISEGCGYSYVYTITSEAVTKNYFQDQKVTQPLISNGSENIRLYFPL